MSKGSTVELNNCGEEFDGEYKITSIITSKKFSVSMDNPGVPFGADTNTRDDSLPYYTRKYYDGVYYVYRINEEQKYIADQQDGIYYLTFVNASNSPTVSQFSDDKFSQPVKNLFPQTNRDNPVSDPQAAKSFASSSLIGEVIVDSPENSITRETSDKILRDTCHGKNISDIQSSSASDHIITTKIDHGLNRITNLSISDPGSDYTDGTYYNLSLISSSGSSVGKHATVKVEVDNGSVTSVVIMDGGSSYEVGNVLKIEGM